MSTGTVSPVSLFGSSSGTSGSTSVFAGTSRYSSDFQQILNRAVAIGQLPIVQMQNGRAGLQAQASALSGLQRAFDGLQASLSGVESSVRGSLGVSVSNGSVASASVTPAGYAGSYSLEVTGLGSESTAISSSGLSTVTDSSVGNISSSSSFTLSLNGDTYLVTPAGSSLRDLADAINAARSGVQASIVNVGGSSSPDYRLALRSTRLAADTISLTDDSGEMLDTVATGSNATYKVNGLTAAIASDTRTVTLAPGLTVNLTGVSDPGVATTISVSRNVGALQAALSGFVAGFNGAVDALQGQHGQSAGALSGQAVVYSLEGLLRSVVSYSSGVEGLPGLSAAGLVLGKDGHLSFDAAAFSAADSSDVSSFFGTLAGTGFLASAKGALDQATDPEEGFLALTAKALNDQISNQSAAIETAQSRLAARQQDLQKRLAASDAAIAAMEQQVSFITSLFKVSSGNNNNQ